MKRRLPIILWLTFLAICVLGVSRARFTADLSAFLPSSPTEEQALLVDLLRDGIASRLILVGIEGGDAPARERASRALAAQLRAHPAFADISNGETVGAEADQRWLFEHRYLLSPAITPQRFTAAGLQQAIGATIDLLSSSAGLLIKPLLLRDPTAETFVVVQNLGSPDQATRGSGVWTAPDGQRALLVATTAASGADTDGQEAAMRALRAAFDDITHDVQRSTQQSAHLPEVRMVMSGPGVFAVNARATIKDEVLRLSMLGAGLIVILLLVVYRSLTALLLGLAPVITGALAGVLAVSLGFGVVHGITLGFGITLIGESVDYAIYYFIQNEGGRQAAFWRTIRLGVLTSLCGFAALLLSGFPGLAQIGLFSMAGLLAAVLTTRYVLPALAPTAFHVTDVSPLGRKLTRLITLARPLRWLPLALALGATTVIIIHRDHLWHHELGALSPVSDADQMLDAQLRHDLAAPDVRYLLVVSGPDAETVLSRTEQVVVQLDRLQQQGVIGGFDTPTRFLPSLATQQARRDALPDAATLRAALATATTSLPLQAGKLEPFIADVEAARAAPLLTRAQLDGTSVAMAVDAMLIHRGAQWRALLPVRSPDSGALNPQALRTALAESAIPAAIFVDIKHESEQLYAGYLRESWTASAGGLAAIMLLLALTLRSARRVLRLTIPLLAAVLVVVGVLTLVGERLILLHLVGMLLVVAVGSNYALFFDAADADGGPPPRTLASLVIANLTTLAGFGILALSTVPVLHGIGVVVGPGAWLALVFSALMFGHTRSTTNAAHG
jgi:predicted exporter